MSNDQPLSDELLNSFVDNELTSAEKNSIYLRIEQDESLNRRVCELCKTRDLVQMAYQDIPPPSSIRSLAKTDRRMRQGIAAGLVFMLGVLFSWLEFSPSAHFIYPHSHQATAKDDGSAKNTGAISGATSKDNGSTGNAGAISSATARDGGSTGNAGAISSEIKILLHLNSGNPEHIKGVLDEAENLLKMYHEQKQPARVEIIANGQGLNLLLADSSPYPKRIGRMQKQYQNLMFAACQSTMDRFGDLGIPTNLLPGVIIIDSAVTQIIRLQREGWVYIQV